MKTTKRGLKVEKCNEKEGVQKYYKGAFCHFCGKEFVKLIKHLESRHSTEKEILKLKGMTKGSQERKKLCL